MTWIKLQERWQCSGSSSSLALFSRGRSSSVVVPGRVHLSVGVPRFVRAGILPAWRACARLGGARSPPRIPTTFAGTLLLGMFLAWVLMLMLGLGLMMYGLRDDFHPSLPSLPEAIFQAGSGMTTLGLGTMRPTGAARALVVLAGLSGLQVVTLTLTYIVQLQMGLQARDPLVVRLATRAGRPASPIRLLLTQKQLGLDGETAALFDRWEQWTADLQDAQKSHPILAYFRSGQEHGDWVTALGTLLDAAAIGSLTLEGPARGHAQLLLAGGTRAARQLCALLGLTPPHDGWRIDPEALRSGLERLRRVGFALPHDGDTVERLRAPYAASIQALATHFGVEMPDWQSDAPDRRGEGPKPVAATDP